MALLIYAVVLLLAAVLESSAGYRLDVLGGARINPVLVLVAVWSLVRGVQQGLLAGLAGGLALDLVAGTPFGLHTVVLGIVGALTSFGGGTLTRGGLALLFGTAVLTTVLYHGIIVLVLRLFGWDFPGLLRFVNVLVPTIFLNALLMPFAAGFARRLDRAMSSMRRMELE
jgi:rod shape-determining protein MreD